MNYTSAMQYRIVHNGTTYKLIGRSQSATGDDPWYDCGLGPYKTLSEAVAAKREAERAHGGTWRVVDAAEQASAI